MRAGELITRVDRHNCFSEGRPPPAFSSVSDRLTGSGGGLTHFHKALSPRRLSAIWRTRPGAEATAASSSDYMSCLDSLTPSLALPGKALMATQRIPRGRPAPGTWTFRISHFPDPDKQPVLQPASSTQRPQGSQHSDPRLDNKKGSREDAPPSRMKARWSGSRSPISAPTELPAAQLPTRSGFRPQWWSGTGSRSPSPGIDGLGRRGPSRECRLGLGRR